MYNIYKLIQKMEVSQDLVNQDENEENYDEYNENNKLVNDISYSYYLKNSSHNSDNSQDNDKSQSNESQKNFTNNTISKKKYNSQLTNINKNLENTLNNNTQKKINNKEVNLKKLSSTLDIRMSERERKKMLLENIQTQIALKKKTKLEELKKRQEEDAQYIKDMIIRYPFGRGGGGAPIRDKSGKVITFRRHLISDPKYNQSPINVDDDYDEVWGKEKKIGRFNVNQYQNNSNNYDDEENTLRPFSTNPQINTIKNNNFNLKNIQNNRYNNNINDISILKQSYNFDNNNILNNRNSSLNNYGNTNNSTNILRNNNLLFRRILDTKKKELELEKQIEDINNEHLDEDQNLLYNIKNNNIRKTKKRIINKNNEIQNENEIENDYYNKNNEIQNKNKIENNYYNKNDYYDNYNFVPKGKIHPRLENSFLFTDEINKLRNEIQIDQRSLLDQINEIKKDAKNAKKERKKVLKDLDYLKFEINRLNNSIKEKEKKDEEEIENEKNYVKKFIKDENYDKYIENMLKRKENNDYYYIDNDFFKNYEYELPNKSSIEKEKKILSVKKQYTDIDENQLELDELIKRSNDILENLRDNEIIEKQYKKRPEDYFNTSDYFYHTYRLNHQDDYKEYLDDYNNNCNLNNN